MPLVGVGLALPDAELDLHAASLEVHSQTRKGVAFLVGGLGQLQDLPLVEKKLAGALGGVLEKLPGCLPACRELVCAFCG